MGCARARARRSRHTRWYASTTATNAWSAGPDVSARADTSVPTVPIELDAERFQARVQGRALVLTPVEFRLLDRLVAQPGRVFSRPQLMDAAYCDHRVVSDRTVDSHVKNLRPKLVELGVNPIASVYGVGYRFEWCDSGDD